MSLICRFHICGPGPAQLVEQMFLRTQVVAEVDMKEGPRRDFVMLRLRSYDPDQLATFVRPLGWAVEMSLPYGVGGPPSTVLMLLRRA
jgi:hypothetical protein